MDNTIKTDSGAEVYAHDIFALADEFIATELSGDEDRVKDYFVSMILYIHDRIPKPDNADIELLDSIFSIYVRLCAKYAVLPTLECFSFLVGLARETFSRWIAGEYRSSTDHHHTSKKWLDFCRSCLVNQLHQKGGTDANKIFIAKAAYGMAETAPMQVENKRQQKLVSREDLGLIPSSDRPELPNTD